MSSLTVLEPGRLNQGVAGPHSVSGPFLALVAAGAPWGSLSLPLSSHDHLLPVFFWVSSLPIRPSITLD